MRKSLAPNAEHVLRVVARQGTGTLRGAALALCAQKAAAELQALAECARALKYAVKRCDQRFAKIPPGLRGNEKPDLVRSRRALAALYGEGNQP